ncbi:PhzF family phenazine biosynthesis protein [Pseudoduganella sp. DS3]|uniref:PhzF family phenazine biosynthesis protein n=1 Tax=Pseudoduganella guangdongensis TaxID=2692179 RepID=A0A6N9HGK9_9BURK|nr:PhzF family phenazine biosynthesis protein [Pseudoduganella guangdongensis]MYN01965.1 PhzF family phenazine biosynthesis protein [Pseudoduganella guangdongensis]
MDIYELKCFGIDKLGGNPALVIVDGPPDAQARQAFAQDAKLSACVFVDPGSAGAAWTLDYFYPHMRSPLCLHATLAAGKILLAGGNGPLAVRTALRGQALQLTRSGNQVFAALAPQTAPEVVPGPGEAGLGGLARRLLAPPGQGHGPALASAPALASVGSPKLLAEVADSATLQALAPDLAAIHDWGKAQGVSGVYAWCRRPDGAFEGRNFNHLDPALEDSATGVAAGALTLHLGHGIRLYQGANRGQPCLLQTALAAGQVLVGGNAMPVPGAP